ncbi:MAG TPA: hypothetical protein PLE60_15185 [Candidatus Latescibacteria bacterium]|nr:hypothetical protein [Candidatus Latescibacterota bacterium]
MMERRWIFLRVKLDGAVDLIAERSGHTSLEDITAIVEAAKEPSREYTSYWAQDVIKANGRFLNNPVKFVYLIEAA